MEWLVIDAVRLRATKSYALILMADNLKMLSEVYCVYTIQAGDILYPVQDATYLINREERHTLTIISAMRYSGVHWRFLKKLASQLVG